MRKVKVAAAFLCLFAAGISGGVTYTGSGMSVAYTDQSNQIVEMTAEAVTTAASIETTAIETTAATASESPNRAARTTTEIETSVTTSGTTTDKTETTATSAETILTQTETMTAPETENTETARTTTVQWTAATEAEQQTVTEPVIEDEGFAIEITEREYIMLCNVVGHEYGAAWVPTEEKALIVEVIMNRVASPQFPDTIYDVLMQPGQFTGIEYLIEMETFSDYYVTQSVKDAVDLYLTQPEEFDHGYLFFSGDGYRSYFRTSY